jgi:hypothetical protein
VSTHIQGSAGSYAGVDHINIAARRYGATVDAQVIVVAPAAGKRTGTNKPGAVHVELEGADIGQGCATGITIVVVGYTRTGDAAVRNRWWGSETGAGFNAHVAVSRVGKQIGCQDLRGCAGVGVDVAGGAGLPGGKVNRRGGRIRTKIHEIGGGCAGAHKQVVIRCVYLPATRILYAGSEMISGAAAAVIEEDIIF